MRFHAVDPAPPLISCTYGRSERRARSSTSFTAPSPADFRERLAALGFDPVASTPEQFSEWIKAEIAKWGKVIRDGNIGVQ